MGNWEWSNRHGSWSHEAFSLMESHTQSTRQLEGVMWRREEPSSLDWGSELPSRGRGWARIWHGGTNQGRQGAVSRGKACLGPMPVNTGQSWQPGKGRHRVRHGPTAVGCEQEWHWSRLPWVRRVVFLPYIRQKLLCGAPGNRHKTPGNTLGQGNAADVALTAGW